MADSFRESEFKGVIVRAPAPIDISNRPGIRINESTAAGVRRPKVTLWRQGRHHDIGIAGTKLIMYPLGTHITDDRSEAVGNLVLHVEIPLQNVISAGLLFNGNVRERWRW